MTRQDAMGGLSFVTINRVQCAQDKPILLVKRNTLQSPPGTITHAGSIGIRRAKSPQAFVSQRPDVLGVIVMDVSRQIMAMARF